MPPVFPNSLEDFVDYIVPELQKRGLYRIEYEGTTFRENIGRNTGGIKLKPSATPALNHLSISSTI